MTLSFTDKKEGSPIRRQKSRLIELIDIKDLRGTRHMPHLEDFAPKRSEIIPPTSNRSHNHLILKKSDNKQQANARTFRKQKYERVNVKV